MSATMDLAAQIAAESASLPPEKQSTVLDFILFMKERVAEAPESEGDAAWERIIANPAGYPKLKAFLDEAEKEAEEPLDLDRL